MDEPDCVFYRIFPQLDELEEMSAVSSSQVKVWLEDLRNQSFGVAYPLAEGYIWQHEPFNLRVCCSYDDYSTSGKSPKISASGEYLEYDDQNIELSSAEAFVPHLAGKVKFGDNLEDEWLVVYLLFEISRRLASASITVRDSDGEFLLIESAYVIPNWIKPDNSHNRVFIRQGALHIVPFPRGISRSRKTSRIALKQSLQVLADRATDTRASPSVQNVILDRIGGYPDKAKENMHKVRCKVPISVAHVLSREPQLIALAVESFYTRDVDSMKAASRMDKFARKGKDGSVELVETVVRMSRAMYAQLVQQVFQAPRTYPMPPLNSPGFREAETGMKITVGFEMLYWERSSSKQSNILAPDEAEGDIEGLKEQPSSNSKDVLTNDAAWKNYRASLEKNGYFRGLLEGSKLHRELLLNALEQYRSTRLFLRASEVMNTPAKRIDELLAIPHSMSDLSSPVLEASDSDHWLFDGEEDLTKIMLERQKERDAYEANADKRGSVRSDSASTSNLPPEEVVHAAEVVKNVQSFVDKISSFEGAEIPQKDDQNVISDEAVELDMNRLLKELESVFDANEISNMLSEEVTDDDSLATSASDLDDSASNDSEDEIQSADTTAATLIASIKEDINGGGTSNPSLSDEGKEEDASFSDEYASALASELKSSSLAKSFAKGKEVASNGDTKILESDREQAEPDSILEPGSDTVKDGGQDDLMDVDVDENDLVDVDVNLVESLLRSYMLQQGMPGPASNLLGAMGMELPDNSDQRPKSREKHK